MLAVLENQKYVVPALSDRNVEKRNAVWVFEALQQPHISKRSDRKANLLLIVQNHLLQRHDLAGGLLYSSVHGSIRACADSERLLEVVDRPTATARQRLG